MSINAYAAAWRWYQDEGIDDVLADAPVDKTAPAPGPAKPLQPIVEPPKAYGFSDAKASPAPTPALSAPAFLGKTDASAGAVQCAKEAGSLEELRTAIQNFDGIALKKTATHMVFSAGESEADIMLIGEAPGKDDDRAGEAFTGEEGALLDRMLASIALDRDKNVYLSTFLNWRPPGGRAPNPAEIETSLPFIEKHIALVKPKLLIFCGATVAKALLGRSESLSRLRKRWHDYVPQTSGLASADAAPIPAIVTYAPAYLLTTPAQKRAAWEDLLEIKAKYETL